MSCNDKFFESLIQIGDGGVGIILWRVNQFYYQWKITT